MASASRRMRRRSGVMAQGDFFRQAELGADFADFVFEQLAQWLDELELHVLRQAPDVVVALDQGGGVTGDGDALDHVGIEGALGEKFEAGFGSGFGQRFHGVVEDADEFIADDLPFPLGGSDPFQPAKEAGGGADRLETDVKIVAEKALDGFGFVGAEEAIVHEDAGELIADGFVQKGGGDAAVHAAAESEKDVIFAHPLADLRADLLDE